MNHSFQASITGVDKCARCSRAQLDHTDLATCECCSNVGPMDIHETMLMCPDCVAKEKAAWAESQKPENIQKRLNEIRVIDNTIQVHTDIFNAETVAIEEIRKLIEADSSIENKHFKLAEIITERYKQFSRVIFDKQNEISVLNTKQKAIQARLNDLAIKLRSDERERLKLQDLQYKPTAPAKPKPIKTNGKVKYDNAELMKYAQEANLPMAALQMICVQKNMSPKDAAEFMKRQSS